SGARRGCRCSRAVRRRTGPSPRARPRPPRRRPGAGLRASRCRDLLAAPAQLTRGPGDVAALAFARRVARLDSTRDVAARPPWASPPGTTPRESDPRAVVPWANGTRRGQGLGGFRADHDARGPRVARAGSPVGEGARGRYRGRQLLPLLRQDLPGAD